MAFLSRPGETEHRAARARPSAFAALVGAAVVVALPLRAQPVDPPPLAPPALAPTADPAAPADEPSPVELTPPQRFRRGKNLFEYGDCNGTVDVLAPLAVPGRLQDAREQLEVHRMLGVCYVLADKQLEASREFSSLLSIDPDYVLDPFLTPPAAIEVYDRQKAAMAEQLVEIRRAREQARESGFDGEGGVLVERTNVVRDVPLAVAFLPLGLAQAANGENVKALIVGITQGVFLGANVAMFWSTVGIAAQPEGQRFDTEEKVASYQILWYGHMLAAIGFAGAYGFGVADALWNREDDAIVDRKSSRRALTPQEIRELQKVAPSPSPAAPPPAAASAQTPSP